MMNQTKNQRMTLNKDIKKLELFYDGDCGLCAGFKQWLSKRIRADVELICEPYFSIKAQQIFPEINRYKPSENLVIRINGQQVYCAEQAWVTCLYVSKNYRWLARIMSCRYFLPHVRNLALWMASNRYTISKTLKLNKK